MSRRLIPRRVRRFVRDSWFRYELGRIRRQVGDDDVIPDRDHLLAANRAWGNAKWSASVHYLVEMCRQATRAQGPILECGSGLTTFLLGVLAARRGLEVWTLEHDRRWYERVQGVLRGVRLDNVRLCHARLRPYDGFEWYEQPAGLPRDFALVICDGPPGEILGGRYGLLPVMASSLAPDCVILLDDAEREAEMEILHRWQEEWHITYQRLGLDHPPAHAVVYLPQAPDTTTTDGNTESERTRSVRDTGSDTTRAL
jgi:hypothetical protein